MNNIIAWCNENSGFLTAIFSALSIVLSTVAICISLNTARLPYKKKLKLTYGYRFDGNDISISITAINCGQRNIKISMMGLLIDTQQYINPKCISENQITLTPSDDTTHYLSIDELKQHININYWTSIYAYAQDTEGKTYKLRVSKKIFL